MRVKYTLSLALVLFGVWLLWSGHFEPLPVTMGAVSCLVILVIVRRMALADHEGAPVEISFRALLYAPWLLWEIVKSNFAVARRILHPGLPIQPHLIRVRAGQRTDLGRVVYANSITLTPGTVSVDIDGDEIVVHALTREAAQGLRGGEMDRRVRDLEGRAK